MLNYQIFAIMRGRRQKYALIGFGLIMACFSLVSCQSQTTKVTADSQATLTPDTAAAKIPPIITPEAASLDLTAVVKATKPWNIVFVIKDPHYEKQPEHDYWPIAVRGAQAAAQAFGVKLEPAYVKAPCKSESQCVEEQIRLISQRLEAGNVDAMIIAPMHANRLVPVTEKVISKGIPVMAVDSAINSPQVLSCVTFDNFRAGKVMGEWLIERVKPNSKILILEGIANQQNSVDRRRGFLAGLSKGDVQVLDTQSAEWNIQRAEQITTKWLQEFPAVDAILAANDAMALGALKAVRKAKRRDILITGYDAIPDAITAIKQGQLAATIDQEIALQMRTSVQLMIRHLEKKSSKLPPVVHMPNIKLVSRENIQS